MKKHVLALSAISAVVLLSGCTVDTTTANYGPEYSGYTVGYVGSDIDDSYVGYGGYGGNVGYGGWASNYYSPGYHYHSWSGAYSGGHGYYQSGYGRGGRRR